MTKLVKIKEKIKASSEIKMVLTEILVFALGFIFMNVRFIFDTFPFGIAFLASQRKYTPFAFCGCLLSVFFLMGGNIAYLLALCGILGLRIIASLLQKTDKHSILLGEAPKNNALESLFCENIEVRVAISVLCGFGLGVYRVVINSYSYYEIFVLIFLSIMCGILTYSLSLTKKRELPLSFAIGCFMLLYAIRGIEIFSLNVSLIIGYGLVLYTSKFLGGIKASALGLLFGLCQASVFTPILALGGLISGLIWTTSPYLAIMSGFAVALSYGVYEGGYTALTELAPELLLISLVMYPLLRFKVIPTPDFIKENARGVGNIDTLILESRNQRDKERLASLTDTFESIAKLIKTTSDSSKAPTRVDYSRTCLEVCEDFCHSCPKNSICWDKNVATTEENINKLGEELFASGQVSIHTVDEKFLHRCPNIESIVKKINHISKENLISSIKNNKLEVASYDYEQISRLLFSTQSEQIKDEYIDKHLSDKLLCQLTKIGFDCDEIRVIGRIKKQILITGINTERTKCTKEELKKSIEAVLTSPVSELIFTRDGSYASMYATTISTYKATELFGSCAKDGEEINGDSYASFDGLDSKRYVLLCDGMGSGREANITSSMCSEFLKSILTITGEKEIALAMLNNLIRARGLESCSTIDLLEIDLVNGKGSFVKSGAAPSYIKRGDKVFKLQSKTMPIGILKDLDAEELSFELQAGDICIMLSDGIVETSEDNDKIMTLLRGFNESIEALPNKIITEAKRKSGKNDDMTVCIAQLLSA